MNRSDSWTKPRQAVFYPTPNGPKRYCVDVEGDMYDVDFVSVRGDVWTTLEDPDAMMCEIVKIEIIDDLCALYAITEESARSRKSA